MSSLLLCITFLFFNSVFRCSNTFAQPLKQAAEGSWGVGGGEGVSLLFTVGKIFLKMLKKEQFLTIFRLSHVCWNTFARKCGMAPILAAPPNVHHLGQASGIGDIDHDLLRPALKCRPCHVTSSCWCSWTAYPNTWGVQIEQTACSHHLLFYSC